MQIFAIVPADLVCSAFSEYESIASVNSSHTGTFNLMDEARTGLIIHQRHQRYGDETIILLQSIVRQRRLALRVVLRL